MATASSPAGYEHPARQTKLALVETAHRITEFRSFADLGGCWGVNGAYSFHAAELCGPSLERAFILDGSITPQTRDRAGQHPRVQLVETLLGSREAHEAVGHVGAVIMFDILLHQVDPDWNDFLLAWSRQTDTLVIHNQNWLKTPRTIRFVERGLEWYRRNVVVWEDEYAPSVERWFARHHERDSRGRLERDSYDFWQWGIRPLELINLLARHGFELVHMDRDALPFGPHYPWIVNDGMVFRRAAFPEASRRSRIRATARALLSRRAVTSRPTETMRLTEVRT
ncbi:MAG: hypothetical protein OXI49_03270 [Acidobacteriota bacterium]|nr:hypothetical protein [Acidobacteriota bacterium]